ncbi:hypothetical protein PROVRETT_07147 [Providencia rettgeri DSM 1131]|nr:hypothetical protein PROVRETT_07147 [Providencia rettgeri DSM 1131]
MEERYEIFALISTMSLTISKNSRNIKKACDIKKEIIQIKDPLRS